MTSPATKATARQAQRLLDFEQRLIEVEAKNLGLFHTLDQLIRTVEALTDSIEAILNHAQVPEAEDEPAPERIDRPAGLRLVPANEPVTSYIAGLSDGAARALGVDQ